MSSPSAVLVDLDNTLVLYNEPAFIQQYFAALSSTFADLIPPESLPERVLMSTVALSSNDGLLNNADFFTNTFLDPGADRAEVWQRFLTFYQTDYLDILPECRPPAGFEAVLADIKASEVKLVLATNPIYPVAAYSHRLSWVGLTLQDFDHITHIENTGFVKPNAGYFRTITTTIGIEPESCLMVGNDPVYDMAASEIGIQTYLITDAAESDYILPGISSDTSGAYTPDVTGPFAEISNHFDFAT